MSRDVRHTATEPIRLDETDIDPEYGDIAICQCGLTDDRPFCDGSHRLTETEAEGVVYRYEGDERREIKSIEYRDTGESE
ncbi:MAG: CDGSH iron-sulfur domain-containing protein [Halobacteriota archaeon]